MFEIGELCTSGATQATNVSPLTLYGTHQQVGRLNAPQI